MNIDRGKESFTDDEVRDLRARVEAHKEELSLSWDKLGKRMGIPGGTLSQWVPGTYKGDNLRIAYEVNKYFLAEEGRLAIELDAPLIPGFQHTPTSRRMMAQLRWAHRGKIVVMTGESGVGKTAAIEQYAATTPQVFVSTMSEGSKSPTSMLTQLLRDMGVAGYRSGGMGGVQTLSYMVMDRIAGANCLFVLDECQYLSDAALNQLRFMHDKCGLGLAICGNTHVMGRISAKSGAGSAPFAQLHSRVSMPAHYARPQAADVDMLLAAWGVVHPKECEFLRLVAAQPGCLRQMTQTLETATLISRQEDEERTLSHLQAAWEQQARPLDKARGLGR